MSDTKAIAFFLPQFHPIPENDQWWGKGFTEWTNVARAKPYFPGHHQPHLPSELGYYDLRLPEVRAQQAALARKYGVYGFCYYYYWFNGRRLLERPLDEILKSGEPDFPFCICWANENWTRRWDGAEQEVLMKQEHSKESDRAFIHDVIPILKDRRYITINGAPLLLVYRPAILPDPKGTTEIWREACREAGLPNVHLCAVQSFGLDDPRPLGFDSAVEFPPHGISVRSINDEVPELDPDFAGTIYDFREVVQYAISRPRKNYPQFRGVMTAWDNTARRRNRGNIFHHASPHEYEVWLRAMVAQTEASRPPGERFVFINAWNEWAEGTHLEPDQRNGYAYLEATARALSQRSDWHEVVRAVKQQPDLPADVLRHYFQDLEFALEAYERSVGYLSRVTSVVDRITAEARVAVFSDVVPSRLRTRAVETTGRIHLDFVQGVPLPDPWVIDRGARTTISGWAFGPGLEAGRADTHAYLVFRAVEGGKSYFAPLFQRTQREDVARHHGHIDARFTTRSGFEATVWCEAVPPGEYRVGIIHADASRAVGGFLPEPVTVK